jgi:copper chaperone CopZ
MLVYLIKYDQPYFKFSKSQTLKLFIMKTLKIFSIALCCSLFASSVFAQKTKTETFQVSGNCGMCEKTIEKAAKAAGATSAEWDMDTKIISVKYSSSTSNLAKIQKSIADAGYDNVGAKATNQSYDKLHGCCKYERVAATEKMDCCKDGKCTMPGHDGKDCCKQMSDKMPARSGTDGDCCKDGKCTKEGHDGKDCCKKEEGYH